VRICTHFAECPFIWYFYQRLLLLEGVWLIQGYSLLIFFAFVLLAALPLNVAIRSEGYDDPGKSGLNGIAYMKINNQEYSLQRRGFNVAVFTEIGA